MKYSPWHVVIAAAAGYAMILAVDCALGTVSQQSSVAEPESPSMSRASIDGDPILGDTPEIVERRAQTPCISFVKWMFAMGNPVMLLSRSPTYVENFNNTPITANALDGDTFGRRIVDRYRCQFTRARMRVQNQMIIGAVRIGRDDA